MKLSQATHQVIMRFGAETLRSDRFFNLVDDFGGFREIPIDSKLHVRELLESGFGAAMYGMLIHPDITAGKKVEDSLRNFMRQSSCKACRIENLAEELLAGVGLSSLLPLSVAGRKETKRETTLTAEYKPKGKSSDTYGDQGMEAPPRQERDKDITATPSRKTGTGRSVHKSSVTVGCVLVIITLFALFYGIYVRRKQFVGAHINESPTTVVRNEHKVEEYTPGQIRGVIRRFGYAVYSRDYVEMYYDRIKKIHEKYPENYWCDFILQRGTSKLRSYKSGDYVYGGEPLTDDELVHALINARFSPDPSKLEKDANGDYVMTDDARMALFLYSAYHDVPPIWEPIAVPYALLRRELRYDDKYGKKYR